MPEIFVCGPASWNQIVNLDELPQPVPHMQFASSSYETLGGTSAGKALHLSELGRTVFLHAVLGSDEAADEIRDALAQAGVDGAISISPGPSERHLNLMAPDGQRVSLYLSTPNLPPRESSVPAAMAGARAIVLDLAPLAGRLIDEALDSGVPIWIDIHDYDGSAAFHRPFIEAASFIFMNADRLPQPLDFMHDTITAGASIVVCTLGADGAIAVDSAHRVLRVPAVPVDSIIDTNGAGDAFFAGFLSSYLDDVTSLDDDVSSGQGIGGDHDIAAALAAGADQAARALGTRHLSPLLDGTDRR